MATLNTTRTRKPPAPRRPQLPPQPASYTPSNWETTHEGGTAARISPELQLRRSVCSCLLWEDEFYESGKSITDRIVELVRQCRPKVVSELAIDVRSSFNLRHVPMLMVSAMVAPGKGGSALVSQTLEQVIQRADEITEFLAIYAKMRGLKPTDLRRSVSAQVKIGLALAFRKFDQYQLSKYFSQTGEKAAPIKARDALLICHPKPKNKTQERLWKRILDKKPIRAGGAGSWETETSAGSDETVQAILKEAAELGAEKKMAPGKAVKTVLKAAAITEIEFEQMRKGDKKAIFERQLLSRKLGYLALLRNLRNMSEAKVDPELIKEAIIARCGAERVLPFRYVAAARAAPQFEAAIDQALCEAISEIPTLWGLTGLLVDVSGSMRDPISAQSDLTRMDAAATLAAIFPGNSRVFTFSNRLVEVPQRFGMAGVQAIIGSQEHSGTQLGSALTALARGSSGFSRVVNGRREYLEPVRLDRLVVITDEQSSDRVVPPNWVERAYLVNVASAKNGVGYGASFVHIDGFSEHVLRFIAEFEKQEMREAA